MFHDLPGSRVMALIASACDHSFSEAPLLHTAIKSCRLSSSSFTLLVLLQTIQLLEDPHNGCGLAGQDVNNLQKNMQQRISCSPVTQPAYELPEGLWTASRWSHQIHQSAHSFLSCSSCCSSNSPSRFGATRTRRSFKALARVAISASPKSSKSSGQVIG